jgi:hypothetical protein
MVRMSLASRVAEDRKSRIQEYTVKQPPRLNRKQRRMISKHLESMRKLG